MLLSVTDVGKAYAGRHVLREISFTLDAGERALLLGPSGSGKSTLLNIICGLQRPDRGEVEIDGEAIASAERDVNGDDARRRHIGIIFQTLRLVSALSVRANLELAQKLQRGRCDPRATDRWLDRLGIAHRAHARPYELSHGEAQRAAIARALVVEPRLLVADEPTSALDNANTRNVAALLHEVAESVGAALLVATHDERLCSSFDRTLDLRNEALAAC